METIIITDVTRFSSGTKLCVAGVTKDGKQCIRPMIPGASHPDYLSYDNCKKYNILPGMVMTGEFDTPKNISGPHYEDRLVKSLSIEGPSTPEEFETLLKNSLSPSVRLGFGAIPEDKIIKPEGNAKCSIVTVQPAPGTLRIMENRFKPGRIQLSFADLAGDAYNYLSITDLGLYDFVGNPKTQKMSIDDVNGILAKNRVYIRVGLSRIFAADDGRNGYWLQANGVYSFPGYSEIIRAY